MVKKVIASAGAGAILASLAMSIAVPQIESLEGTRNTAYRDIVGVLTICSGHTGTDVTVNKVYDKTQCTALTQQDAQKAADGVLKTSPQLLYHPMQLAAAISFSFNVGVGTYNQSSVARDFNAGNFTLACNDLSKYTYAGGQVSQGLVNRRQQEVLICMSTLTPQGLANVTSTPSPTQ